MCHPVHTIYHIVYLNPICRRWNQVERLKHGIPQESCCSVHRHWWCWEVSEWWWWCKVNVLKDWPLSSFPVGPSCCSGEFYPNWNLVSRNQKKVLCTPHRPLCKKLAYSVVYPHHLQKNCDAGPSSFEELGPSKWSVSFGRGKACLSGPSSLQGSSLQSFAKTTGCFTGLSSLQATGPTG